MKHVLMEPSDPHLCASALDCGSCWLCDGGLAMCKVCRLSEVELDDTPECPGAPHDDLETR